MRRYLGKLFHMRKTHSKKKKHKLISFLPEYRGLPLGAHIYKNVSSDLTQFPNVDSNNWEKKLDIWLNTWRRFHINIENVNKLESTFRDYYKNGINVFFIQRTLMCIWSYKVETIGAKKAKVDILPLKNGQLDCTHLVEKEQKKLESQAKKRHTHLWAIQKECVKKSVNYNSLVEIEKECQKADLETALENIAHTKAYNLKRKSLRVSDGKKFTHPLLCSEIACLVNFLSQYKKFDGFKKKGLFPEVKELLNYIGVSLEEKTIEGYCTLAKTLPPVPFPIITSN